MFRYCDVPRSEFQAIWIIDSRLTIAESVAVRRCRTEADGGCCTDMRLKKTESETEIHGCTNKQEMDDRGLSRRCEDKIFLATVSWDHS